MKDTNDPDVVAIVTKIVDCRAAVAMDQGIGDPLGGPLHLPHAPSYWAMTEYEAMREAFDEAHAEMHDRDENDVADESDCEALRANFTIQAIVAAFMTGVKYAQTGNTINLCTCGDLNVETLEELNSGAWSTPARPAQDS